MNVCESIAHTNCVLQGINIRKMRWSVQVMGMCMMMSMKNRFSVREISTPWRQLSYSHYLGCWVMHHVFFFCILKLNFKRFRANRIISYNLSNFIEFPDPVFRFTHIFYSHVYPTSTTSERKSFTPFIVLLVLNNTNLIENLFPNAASIYQSVYHGRNDFQIKTLLIPMNFYL